MDALKVIREKERNSEELRNSLEQFTMKPLRSKQNDNCLYMTCYMGISRSAINRKRFLIAL